jgi:tetratricopeptide (TPR) repeat protein
MQRSFFLSAQRRHEHIGGPEPDESRQYQSVLDDMSVMIKRMHTSGADRYLQMANSWHRHFREAGQHQQANGVAITILPAAWMLKEDDIGRGLVKALLENTPSNSPQYNNVRYWQAVSVMTDRDYPKALTLLAELEGAARKQNQMPLLCDVLERQGEVYRNQGKHSDAMRKWKSALEQRDRLKDVIGTAHTLLFIGENARFHGDQAEAVRTIEAALRILSEQESLRVNLRTVASLLLYRAHIFRKVRSDISAIDRYNEVLQIGQQIGEGYYIGKGLEGIGYMYGLLGQFDVAARHLLQAIDVYEKISDMTAMTTALTRLAMVYTHKGNNAEAMVFCERALQLAEEHAPGALKQTTEMLRQLKRKNWLRLLK